MSSHAAISEVPISNASLSGLFDVKGLIAVITGGASGIGLMMAKALEHSGAVVFILDIRVDAVNAAAKKHNRFGNLIPLGCDVTSQKDILSTVAIIKARFGYVNLLVNNAGVGKPTLPKDLNLGPSSSPLVGGPSYAKPASISTLQSQLWSSETPEEFGQTFAVNTTAPYYTTVAFLELLDAGNRSVHATERGVSSQVITVSSGGAFRCDAKVFSVCYTLSKAASLHLGKLLTNMLSGWNIRSNLICPGVFPSEMTAFLTPEQARAGVPVGRSGDAQDMAGLIIFMSSRAGAYLNGSVQLIDGGRLSMLSSTF